MASKQFSYPKDKIKILLLEAVHPAACQRFEEAGYQVDVRKEALSDVELSKALTDVHILGIRSKTTVTPKILSAAPSLLSIGCFCIGTNQVALESAADNGVVVFNAPFSNTRSVAELALAEIICLSRRTCHVSAQLHQGKWEKSAAGCYEVRGKVLGVIGYGHIGPQLGLLAESLGMQVLFYDINKKLSLGNARQVDTLQELLALADFVSLHVPETSLTKNMIAAPQLATMKKGSFLINLSRGTVVDIDALAHALGSQHLAGAAIDVFPIEPNSNDEPFQSALQGIENVILTPHVGGSTLEAQRNIGIEVADALIRYLDLGSSAGSVNFPQLDMPLAPDRHRVLNIHRNVPGVLRDINRIVADMSGNILAQQLGTQENVGYLIMDVDPSLARDVKREIEKLPSNIRTRVLF